MRRLGLLALGAYVCGLGSFVHRHVVLVGGAEVPWGLVLAIAVTYVVTLAADAVCRAGGAWFGLGWGVVLMGQQFSPGGSYLVASDWLGWGFTGGCLGVIVLAVARPLRLEG